MLTSICTCSINYSIRDSFHNRSCRVLIFHLYRIVLQARIAIILASSSINVYIDYFLSLISIHGRKDCPLILFERMLCCMYCLFTVVCCQSIIVHMISGNRLISANRSFNYVEEVSSCLFSTNKKAPLVENVYITMIDRFPSPNGLAIPNIRYGSFSLTKWLSHCEHKANIDESLLGLGFLLALCCSKRGLCVK